MLISDQNNGPLKDGISCCSLLSCLQPVMVIVRLSQPDQLCLVSLFIMISLWLWNKWGTKRHDFYVTGYFGNSSSSSKVTIVVEAIQDLAVISFAFSLRLSAQLLFSNVIPQHGTTGERIAWNNDFFMLHSLPRTWDSSHAVYSLREHE